MRVLAVTVSTDVGSLGVIVDDKESGSDVDVVADTGARTRLASRPAIVRVGAGTATHQMLTAAIATAVAATPRRPWAQPARRRTYCSTIT